MFGWAFLADVDINPYMESDAPLSKDSTKYSHPITNWILTFLILPPKSTISVIAFLRGSFLSWNKRPIILYQVYSRVRIPLISPRAITKPGIKFYRRRRFRGPLS
jgi:hypothetical protein